MPVRHGTTGSGAGLLTPTFGGELFGPGQPLASELGLLQGEVKRIRNGRFVILPASAETAGHGTTGQAKFWKQHLADLLQSAPRRGNQPRSGRKIERRHAPQFPAVLRVIVWPPAVHGGLVVPDHEVAHAP